MVAHLVLEIGVTGRFLKVRNEKKYKIMYVTVIDTEVMDKKLCKISIAIIFVL